MKVSEKLAAVQQKIAEAARRSGRQAKEITVIGVTKYVTAERAQEALEAGILHFGENRPEGLLEKQAVLPSQAVWHFIGSLQTRKVKSIVDRVDFIHSLDRESLAKEINRRTNKPVQCFVQVNVSGEAAKHGLAPEEAVPFVQMLEQYEHIRVCGLMTMAPLTEDRDLLRACFQRLAACREEIRALGLPYAPCTELSMGMSNDYEIAIEEGATMVRIGTALVGE